MPASEVSTAWPRADAVLLDVRTEQEYHAGHVLGSLHINMMGAGFQQRLEKLDKNKEYYVLCRSGNRSSAAASLMIRKGFTKVTNLRGGIVKWQGELK
ncbi:MAG TPA: rhodanese-like domain-containing protein [Cytophagales bacterium]|nr:rhodanese-like domain-containing protein [Cytophagales bacterium]HAA17593.1 rhodanese-like domain-containing protein [Cytophagales bacterium]HAP61663.1 rhodanese-like domain-containing protein [Cytophagales bacterium]